jgi:hypothetical protein
LYKDRVLFVARLVYHRKEREEEEGEEEEGHREEGAQNLDTTELTT